MEYGVRNFQRGTVLINSSNTTRRIQLEDGFEKILGSQDTRTNNGALVGSVTLQTQRWYHFTR